MVHSPRRGIRTEIARTILHHLPRHSDLGIWLRPAYFDIRVTFIVLEANVVTRAVFLDEVHLEDERLKFGSDDNPFNVDDIARQPSRLCVMTRVRVKV